MSRELKERTDALEEAVEAFDLATDGGMATIAGDDVHEAAYAMRDAAMALLADLFARE